MTNTMSRKPIVIIKTSEIKNHYTMAEAIDGMEEAFTSLSAGKCFVPLRYVTTVAEDQLHLLLKPAAVASDKRVTIKILTQKEMGALRGIPAIVGIVMVIDSETGEILAIMDGEYITALRTGAAGGLGTRYFSREDSKVAAIFGCGAQGKTQLEAVAVERQLEKVYIFDRFEKAGTDFIAEMQPKFDFNIEYTSDNRVLKECDIICTATGSESPLFSLGEIKEGTHINAIGSFKPNMQEIDPAIMKAARVYVDQLEPCIAESGDLIKPIEEGVFSADHIKGEIGEFGLGKIEGRTSEKDITLFKTVGVAIQDYVVGNKVYDKSQQLGFGQSINLFD